MDANRLKLLIPPEIYNPSGYKLQVYDEFTDTDAVALSAHTIAPVNVPAATWTKKLNDSLAIASNKIVGTGLNTNYKEYVLDSGKKDCIIKVKLKYLTGTTGGIQGIVARYTDTDNKFRIGWVALSGILRIADAQAGTNTTRASVAYTMTDGEEAWLTAVLLGDLIIAYINNLAGSLQACLVYSSAFNNTATKHGLNMFGTTILEFDNFSIGAA